MKTASDFLHQLQHSRTFIAKAKLCGSDDERRSFLIREGFNLEPDEFPAAIKCLSFLNKSGDGKKEVDQREAKRYDVYLQISELDGKPVSNSIIVDISSWGAKVESQIPLTPDSPVELCISLAESKGRKKKYRLAGKVMWASQLPVSNHSEAGVRFEHSLEKLQKDDGSFLEKLTSTAVGRQEDIAGKEFLSIREFAKILGVHWFTVWRWTVERRIEFRQVKTGCKILIPRSELMQFQST